MAKAALLALVLIGSMVGCSSQETMVQMIPGRMFFPDRLEVATGTTVTFANTSDDSHTVTAVESELPEGAEYFASGGFDSEAEARDDLASALLRKGGSFTVTFEEPGTYAYLCIPHEADGMSGVIVVTAT